MTEKAANRRPIAFISHHSSQEQTARHLKTILERNGVEGWMAPDDVEPGRPFDQAIIEEIEACDMIVLLFCSQSDESRHVKRELMMAENHHKLIYPIRLEDIDAKGLAYWLNDYQWIDWMDRRDETIDRLVETIKKQVPVHGGEEEPDADEPAAPSAVSPTDTETPSAEPVPADTAPMALAGATAESAAKPGPFGLNRTTLIFGGAVGAILLIALLLALGSQGDGESGGQTPLQAGNWRTMVEMQDVSVEGGTQEMENLLRQQMDTETQSSTECVTEEEAADPGGEMLTTEELGNNCQVTNSHFADGDIEMIATCQVPNVGPARLSMEGRYNRTQIVADIEMTMESEIGNIRVEGELVSERIGDCN